MSIGLYIHIPFCRRKCAYCDFPSYAGCEHLYQDYTAALCREIAGKGGIFSQECVDTLYIGGGTPTLLPKSQLLNIVNCLSRHWNIAGSVEFSIEANPGMVDLDKLSFLRGLGINRVSFGIQSFSDALLRKLGRLHTAREAREAVEFARQAGFDNINIDLMSGLPQQTRYEWAETLSGAVELGVQHISAYGLKVEEGTPFFLEQQQGCLLLPSDEEDEAMYDLTEDFLALHGFSRYEISNYAAPGRQCLHNLKYWHYQPYLGMGAGAHSFENGRRTANTVDVPEYISAINRHDTPAVSAEYVERTDAIAEFTFLALRTARGVLFSDFTARFGIDFRHYFAKPLAELVKDGMLLVEQDKAFLTKKGMKFGNAAFMAFLPDKP